MCVHGCVWQHPRHHVLVLHLVPSSFPFQSIVRPLQASHQDSSPSRSPDVSSTMNRTSPLGDEVEDPTTVNTAIFYSIISTQKGQLHKHSLGILYGISIVS